MEFSNSGDDENDLRRGPWTREEDNLLTCYISCHGKGRWNVLAKRAGLKRTGKSCRLRWLNYLTPDIKRGNLTAEEQLLILELHHKWGNRWSKIAQYLPGRTDNEIKNYWRTRVQKQARQLNVESNSQRFLDAFRSYWIPRLHPNIEQDLVKEQMGPHSGDATMQNFSTTTALSPYSMISADSSSTGMTNSSSEGNNLCSYYSLNQTHQHELPTELVGHNATQQPDFGECYMDEFAAGPSHYYNTDQFSVMTPLGACNASPSRFQGEGGNGMDNNWAAEGFWGMDVDDDDIWQLRRGF
ncbi:hypothetical protein MLD38_017501 [Melastoma candidum]|uniref:Uncharacterized protein n=1 Tax=Melastoma candidum TaxID=119954 RepID=A0ACB9QTY4_9MYRT|nr:hypothetical protein MLD38_017501 [Melastoma candidum]